MPIRIAQPSDATWFAQRTGYTPGGDFVAFVATNAQGVVRGLVGFDCFKPNSAQAHMAFDSPAAMRELLRKAANFIFNFGGKGVVLGTVAANHKTCRAAAKRIGFTETHRVRDGWAPGVDLVCLELRKENCRWLPKPAAERQAA